LRTSQKELHLQSLILKKITVDIFEKFRSNKGNIGQYMKQAHGYFAFPKLEGEIGARMTFRGKEV
jgi:glycine C-acetyltransferase